MPASLDDLTRQTIDRYRRRYAARGRHVRTLGWGTVEQQRYRFEQTLRLGVDFAGRHVLDIGCGFADYAAFLREADVPIAAYTGWEVNPDLAAEAQGRFEDDATVRIAVRDVFRADPSDGERADVGVMLGLLNFHWHDAYDNLVYTETALRQAFACVDEALIVDFLSAERTPDYPEESAVFYHDPAAVLRMALSLTPDVVLHHDYAAIPQKEFLVVLYRDRPRPDRDLSWTPEAEDHA